MRRESVKRRQPFFHETNEFQELIFTDARKYSVQFVEWEFLEVITFNELIIGLLIMFRTASVR